MAFDESVIEIRVERIEQLFDMLDPFPFRERDLDAGAEEYIVGWARELPKENRFKIVIHLPASEAESQTGQELEGAFRRYFGYRVDVIGRELKELFRIGRRALLIGLAILGLCLVLGQLVPGRIAPERLGRFVEEGLIILGWVAMWRPIETFLYDWWPLVRRRGLYLRLSSASIALKNF